MFSTQSDKNLTPGSEPPDLADHRLPSPALPDGSPRRYGRPLGIALLGIAGLLGSLEAPPDRPAAAEQPPAAGSPAEDIRAALRLSLPRSEGEAALPGLGAAVDIERDKYGVPHIKAKSFADALAAQGYLHAQERFFQMDAARRQIAGRLSELLGPDTVGSDKHYRTLQFEQIAGKILEKLPADEIRALEAYAKGVNAGLKDLQAPPPEYALLKAAPQPWSPRDTVLVLLAMFDQMHFSAPLELSQGVMKDTLPPQLYSFLTQSATRFDAPLIGESGYRPMPIPGDDVINLRAADARPIDRNIVPPLPATPGSNNWAVSGKRSAHGSPIVANDPHLSLSAPGTWYRCELEWGERRLEGVSLPGSPGIAIGSNGNVAWGFTNALIDAQDYIIVDKDPKDGGRYMASGRSEPFSTVKEIIKVRGAPDQEIEILKTCWGPITRTDYKDRPLVLKWSALEPEMVNLAILRMADAKTTEEAASIMARWYGPSQNAVIAGKDGHIAWVVTGYLPKRSGFDGTIPVRWSEEVGWKGPIAEEKRPKLSDPASGVIFTANQRTVDADWSKTLGMTPDLPARARRISELLRSGEKLSEGDMLKFQLDTRVAVLDLYKDLAIEACSHGRPTAEMLKAKEIISRWNGTADADQAAFRILAAFRDSLHEKVLAPLLAPCHRADPSFQFPSLTREEPVRRILEDRPIHLLPKSSPDWKTLIAATLEETAGRLSRSGSRGLETPWGEDNRAAIRHPLADSAPGLAELLSMPATPLDGYRLAVRVADPSYGASMRMIVSPGCEEKGILELPAGQSGHPLSPAFRNSHEHWLKGERVPFLKGRSVSQIRLKPAE